VTIPPRGGKRFLSRLGLLEPARFARDLYRSRRFIRPNLRYWRDGAPDRLPIPPLSLRLLVAGSPDIGWFLDSGRRGAESIRATLLHHGRNIGQCHAILDFGCGCGRVLRHWSGLPGEIHGTDLNPRLVDWCRRGLPFARFHQNALTPPLDFELERFDLVYALSVFTHLPEALQHAWIADLFRVLRPDGCLLLTTHGRRYIDQLTKDEARCFLAGGVVVREDGVAGSNACGAYHPEAWVRAYLVSAFEVLDFIPEGALGNPWQDFWVLRRP
jgi:SAM-dependent methyltransferase